MSGKGTKDSKLLQPSHTQLQHSHPVLVQLSYYTWEVHITLF